ncbi:hypothetical protein E2C01_014315 [Portunus trituberculatus]|uniref:Uncharacterized protein n=1 Tax=Portunus trituberculatus TaxID=210409 RepID=A0A5B7DIG4_PORTR|nr:hypothetical protein [Portunus trituberculatus]
MNLSECVHVPNQPTRAPPQHSRSLCSRCNYTNKGQDISSNICPSLSTCFHLSKCVPIYPDFFPPVSTFVLCVPTLPISCPTCRQPLTSGVFGLDGLFEWRDVPESAQEQHHNVLLVLDGRDVQEEP